MNFNESKIANALFTKTQQQVLGLLYGQSDQSFYLNEIVRLAAMGKGTIRRELEKLCLVGLLKVTKQGNQNHYQANSDNPIFPELKIIIQKTFGLLGVLKNNLHDILLDVELAFIYGSVAKNQEHANSDIDLLIVAENISYTELMESIQPAEQQLGRTINPTIYSKAEFKQRIESRQSFLIRVLSQRKIWLKGESVYNEEFNGIS